MVTLANLTILLLEHLGYFLRDVAQAEREEHYRHLAPLALALAALLMCRAAWNRDAPEREAAAERRALRLQAAAAEQSTLCVSGRNLGADPEECLASRALPELTEEELELESPLCVSGRQLAMISGMVSDGP